MTRTEHDDALGDYTADSRILTLTLMAGLIGVISALVALALVRLIGLFTNLAYFHRVGGILVPPADSLLGAWRVLIPAAGGIVVGLMARYGSDKIRGHGIPEAIEAILLGRSRMDAKVAVLKPLSSAIAIGTGGPFGAEGPIIVTGGAFGSLFGQAFHLSAAERKTLLVAGAAGGMSAIFATPVAGVLIAVELLLFEWKPRSFIPVACSSAVAGVLRVPLLGSGPIFPVVPHHALPATTLLIALGIGLTAGLASTGVTALVYGLEDAFRRLPLHWMWWPAIGGLLVGLGGLVTPRALGVGYDVINDLLDARLVGAILVGLLFVKALIWAIALSSGTSGGVLAPLLIMGGALGALGAESFHASDVGLWAMIGMASLMGGTMQLPLTSMVFVMELTGDAGALPALLVGTVASAGVTVLLMKRSILTEKLARRGQHVMREYIVNPLHLLRVEDVMERDVPTVPANLPVDALFHRLSNEDPVVGRRHAWPIVDEAGHLVGMITRGDLVRALESEADGATALDAGSRNLVVTYPDELLGQATTKMLEHDIGRLPVVNRHDPTQLVGYLGRAGVMAAWLHAAQEEGQRDTGWLGKQLGRLRERLNV